MNKSNTVRIRVTEEEKELLKNACDKTNMSMSMVIREAINEYLNNGVLEEYKKSDNNLKYREQKIIDKLDRVVDYINKTKHFIYNSGNKESDK